MTSFEMLNGQRIQVRLFQVMCRAVTIPALRKLFKHLWWVRFAVARLTRWYALMFLLVTIRTGKIVVFGRIGLKQGYGFTMATPAVM
jgi:hypothetical protein